jgi:hypothetical protein
MRGFGIGALCAISWVLAQPASAVVLASDLPTGDALAWSNKDSLQTFLVRFTLDHAALIDGFGIVHSNRSVGENFPVTIRYAADVGGQPGALTTFADTIDVRTHYAGVPSSYATLSVAHFDPIRFAAGTYWMGMSGRGANQLTWYGVLDGGPNAPADQRQILQGVLKPNAPSVHNLPFVVEGSFTPEPAAWALMILGLGAAGAALRRARPAVA